jgi:hypothetical protein
MTRQEIELLQCALDKIGAGLDAIADLVCAIETKAKGKSDKIRKSKANGRKK